MGADQDQRGPGRLCARRSERRVERIEIVAVGHVDRLPAVGFEALRAVLGERHVDAGREGDRVVVVEADQLAELQVARERRRFRRDAFHQIAVAGDNPGSVVNDGVARAVVARGKVRFGDGHADRVRETLAERAGRDLDAGSVAALGMARRLAAPLTKLLDVVEREVVAGDMEQAVQEGRSVPCGEHEAVAIRPKRVLRVVLQLSVPERVSHRRSTERQAGMAAVGLLDHVDGQEAEGIDAKLIEGIGHRNLAVGQVNRGASVAAS